MACELGVFDHLHASERPLTTEDVSQELGTSKDGTERLLSACVGLELLNAQYDEKGQGTLTYLHKEAFCFMSECYKFNISMKSCV